MRLPSYSFRSRIPKKRLGKTRGPRENGRQMRDRLKIEDMDEATVTREYLHSVNRSLHCLDLLAAYPFDEDLGRRTQHSLLQQERFLRESYMQHLTALQRERFGLVPKKD